MSEQLPQLVSNWLFNVIQPLYDNKEIVYTHVYQFLQIHLKKNLNFKVRTRVYTSSGSGQSCLLINLFGAIVINEQVSVPLEIWIPTSYPYVSATGNGMPLVYIVPDHSRNWYLRPSNNVDTQGMFYHPYMSSWYQECSQSNPAILNKYNLVELINVVYHSVTTNCPIVTEQPMIANVPPKPAKISINSSSGTTSLQSHAVPVPQPPPPPPPSHLGPVPDRIQADQPRLQPETTGPPLPAKPPKVQSPIQSQESTTPLKYQSPLPLPNEANAIQRPFTYPEERMPSPLHPVEYTNRNNLSEYSSGSGIQSATIQPVNQPEALERKIPSPTPVDLMDNENTSANTDQARTQMLNQLANNINSCLIEDEINEYVNYTNENAIKVDALYKQLDHHFQQAKGNSRNLDDHINYLSTQLTNLTNLNRDLSQLDEKNSQDHTSVSINPITTVPLDDLIIPDLPLTKQLYEVVLEIKAIKDTINLIMGNFQHQKEAVNDDRFDACVKIVRNMGRDLFWLEMTKDEIAKKIMKLT